METTGKEPRDEDSPAFERHKMGLGTFLVPVVTGLVIYVLSLGPAVRWHSSFSPTLKSAIQLFYAPLAWLHQHTPLRDPLEWYVEVWERKPVPPAPPPGPAPTPATPSDDPSPDSV